MEQMEQQIEVVVAEVQVYRPLTYLVLLLVLAVKESL
jgi:hypothetical protein